MVSFLSNKFKMKLNRCRFVGYHRRKKHQFKFYDPRDETVGLGVIQHELFDKSSLIKS